MEREVRIVQDAAALSQEAAEEFLRVTQAAIASRKTASVALAGGSTPRLFYERLASEPYRGRIRWDRLHLFWGDERCVPTDHPESNFRLVAQALLLHVPIPPANVHRIPVEHGDSASAAHAYERIMRDHFHLMNGAMPMFDLLILGLGEDGHTASLFPNAAALRQTDRLAVETQGGVPNVPRVTLTLSVINHARRVMWLVNGAKKASVVSKILNAHDASEFPAQHVQPVAGTAVWLLDREAASELTAEQGRR